LKQAILYLKRKYEIKPREIDAYAINYDPRLMALTMRHEWWISTFENLITKGISLGLFQGGLIGKGLGALRSGLFLSSW